MKNMWYAIGAFGRLTFVLLMVGLAFGAGSAFAAIKPSCSWDHPGANRYIGEVPAAVDSYTDIPADIRANLKRRMERRLYDDVVVIKRDSIEGFETRYTDLRDMHFGKGDICRTVSRAKWTEKHEERGLIYCERDHCIIVPTVCGNVSRVTLIPEVQLAALTVKPQIPPGGDFTSKQPTFTEVVQYAHAARNWPFYWHDAPTIVDRPRVFLLTPPPVVIDPPVVTEPPAGEPPVVVVPPTQPPGASHPPHTDNPPPWFPPPVSPPVPEPTALAMITAALLVFAAWKYGVPVFYVIAALLAIIGLAITSPRVPE